MSQKRLKYRLQIVLDQKEKARDAAASYLSEMRLQLQKEQAEEARLRHEHHLNRERRTHEYELIMNQGMTGGGLEVNETQQRLNFIKFLDVKGKEIEGQIEMQVLRVQKAERAVEEALQELIRASRELQVMEKHKERWLKKTKKAIELEEQNEMNEIGNVMYSQNQRLNAKGV